MSNMTNVPLTPDEKPDPKAIKPRLGVTLLASFLIVAGVSILAGLLMERQHSMTQITQNEKCITKLITAYEDEKNGTTLLTDEISEQCPYIQLD